jgi:hypothetical protein
MKKSWQAGDLSRLQMVTRVHQERNRQRNRGVYNDWSVSTFIQMLIDKCQPL